MKRIIFNIKSLLVVMLCLIFSATFTSCSKDEPSWPNNVPQGVNEIWIAIMDSNYGPLPGTATILYEDEEFQYRIAARNKTFEFIILPFYMQDGEWIPAYKYDSTKNVGNQLTPLKYNDAWLCSIARTGNVSSIEEITGTLNPTGSSANLSVRPFQWKDGFYGYITIAGGRIINVRLYDSFIKYDRTQGSSSFGCIQSAKLEYEFFN